jgi:hypothetical protein
MPELLVQLHEAETPNGGYAETRCPYCNRKLDVTVRIWASQDDIWVDIARSRK